MYYLSIIFKNLHHRLCKIFNGTLIFFTNILKTHRKLLTPTIKKLPKQTFCLRLRNKAVFLIFRHCFYAISYKVKKHYKKVSDRSTACGRRNKVAFLIFRHCVLRNFLQIKKPAQCDMYRFL